MVNLITEEEAGELTDDMMPEFFKHPDTEKAQIYFKEVEKADRAEEIKRFEKRFRTCGANRKDMEDAGFDKAIFPTDRHVKIFNECLDFVNRTVTVEGFNKVLVLCGKPGVGKTFYALSTIRMLCGREKPHMTFTRKFVDLDENGNPLPDLREVVEDSNIKDFYSGLYTTSEELADVCNMKFKDGFEKSAQKAQLRYFKTTKLLVIDEIGRVNIQKVEERNNLFTVINARMSNYLPTILCTNYEEFELQDVCGDALWSRIKGNGRVISLRDFDNMRSPEKQKQIKEWRQRNEK